VVEADSSAFPEGFLDRPFDGRARLREFFITARFSVLLVTRLQPRKVIG
jgi:hypothetical protein